VAASADFPEGFLWGVATSAFQIEGAVAADGRGPSIWDTFSHTPGRIRDGDTADVACDHYHRYPEDVRLMADLGVGAYRFSAAWSRIQPDGRGAPDQRGLDFYRRLTDELHEHGIAPCLTLYHWDLPQALEDAGGWLNRDTAERFAEYAGHVATALGDRVPLWITLNEPFVQAAFGYALGFHAPGRNLLGSSFPATHHLLLGHGRAVQALRAALPAGPQVGVTHSLLPAWPATDSPEDWAAASRLEDLQIHTYVSPVLRGTYPDRLAELYPGADLGVIHDGDLATTAAPLDFLGVNYYSPNVVKAAAPDNPLGFEFAPLPGVEVTSFGWPVVPEAFTELLTSLRTWYGDALPPIYITENGACYDDEPDAKGFVQDDERISYVERHLAALRASMEAGVDVRGYFLWSLIDNFEWAEGYSKRFGLVRVDDPTQARIPKASFGWYRDLIRGSR
jgi:beta-glucosidase